LVVLYNMPVAGVRVVEFGTKGKRTEMELARVSLTSYFSDSNLHEDTNPAEICLVFSLRLLTHSLTYLLTVQVRCEEKRP